MTLVQRIIALSSVVVAELRAQRQAVASVQSRVATAEQTLATVLPTRTDVQLFMAATLQSSCDSNRTMLKSQFGIK